MSLYGALVGESERAETLLGLLGITRSEVPRYRDCYVDEREFDSGKEFVICVYTRTGGGNREYFMKGNAAMTKVPGYQGDRDDDFDSTYATFVYRVDHSKLGMAIGEPTKEATPADKFQAMLSDLESGATSPTKGNE